MLKNIVLLGTSVTFGALSYLLFKRLAQKLNSKQFYNILFFPDQQVACMDHFTKRHGCTSPVCKYSHDDTLSCARLMSCLKEAKCYIDVCVFCFTCSELAILLCDLNKSGICIRVITDSGQMHSVGSQIARLRKSGVQIRQNDSTFYMHHKFAIVDNNVLINGSFNWTRSAITGNFENVCITNNEEVVTPYVVEFQRLWTKFDPRNQQASINTH